MNVKRTQTPRFFDAPAAMEGSKKRASMLYSVLPIVVQNHIPALPSIRRAIGGIRSRSPPLSACASASEVSPPRTPPPDYTSQRNSIGSFHSSTCNSVMSTDDEDPFQEAVSERLRSSMSTPPPFISTETRSGIVWKYANQGSSLISQAYVESQTPDETAGVLSRQLYIHSMTYLLRGLPSDLTSEEILSMQSALPPSLVDLSPDCPHALVPLHPDTSTQQGPVLEPSLLHRVTALIVFETLILLQFLVPYMKLFVSHAYHLERKHRITQRLVNNGLMTADAVRRGSLRLTHTVLQMNDGKVGQAISDVTVWWVRGLTGGLQQGIQEGFRMAGNGRGMEESGPKEA